MLLTPDGKEVKSWSFSELLGEVCLELIVEQAPVELVSVGSPIGSGVSADTEKITEPRR